MKLYYYYRGNLSAKLGASTDDSMHQLISKNILLLKIEVNTSTALLSRNCMKLYYHYCGNL